MKTKIAIEKIAFRGISEEESKQLQEAIYKEIVALNEFDIMDRGKMNEILKKNGKQLARIKNENKKYLQFGKLGKVAKIILPGISITKDGNKFNLKILDVAKGKEENFVLKAFTGEFLLIFKEIRPLVYQLFKKALPKEDLVKKSDENKGVVAEPPKIAISEIRPLESIAEIPLPLGSVKKIETEQASVPVSKVSEDLSYFPNEKNHSKYSLILDSNLNLPFKDSPFGPKKNEFPDILASIYGLDNLRTFDTGPPKTVITTFLSPASLNIVTEPPGAIVLLDNEFLGMSPVFSVMTSEGKHNLIIKKDSFRNHRQELDLLPLKTKNVFIPLEDDLESLENRQLFFGIITYTAGTIALSTLGFGGYYFFRMRSFLSSYNSNYSKYQQSIDQKEMDGFFDKSFSSKQKANSYQSKTIFFNAGALFSSTFAVMMNYFFRDSSKKVKNFRIKYPEEIKPESDKKVPELKVEKVNFTSKTETNNQIPETKDQTSQPDQKSIQEKKQPEMYVPHKRESVGKSNVPAEDENAKTKSVPESTSTDKTNYDSGVVEIKDPALQKNFKKLEKNSFPVKK